MVALECILQWSQENSHVAVGLLVIIKKPSHHKKQQHKLAKDCKHCYSLSKQLTMCTCRSKDREHRSKDDRSRHEGDRRGSDRRRSSREDQPAPENAGRPSEEDAAATDTAQEQQAGQDLQVSFWPKCTSCIQAADFQMHPCAFRLLKVMY